MKPLTLRFAWFGMASEEQEDKSYKRLAAHSESMAKEHDRWPCAIFMDPVDAYDLAATTYFQATHSTGPVIGRAFGLSIVIDPDGIKGVAELVVCTGCLDAYPACQYAAVVR